MQNNVFYKDVFTIADANAYLDGAIRGLMKDLLFVSISKPLSLFKFLSFSFKQRKVAVKRKAFAEKGIPVPPFVIASIANTCNLTCKGCYASVNQKNCSDMLTSLQWNNIFSEASALGVSFMLLAGGEPLIRFEVIESASKHGNIIFPVFTNGLLIDDNIIRFLNGNRNIVPVLSLEGDEILTDARRGAGTYLKLNLIMQKLKKNRIFFGVSITVTAENLQDVTSDEFAAWLSSNGSGVAFYIEYVPVNDISGFSAFGGEERSTLESRVMGLNNRFKTLFISFPGDEKLAGGCLASGRGFVHINPSGGLEPCPFSPYSDVTLKDSTLAEALKSPFLNTLRDSGLLTSPHIGGCILWDRKTEVEAMIR